MSDRDIWLTTTRLFATAIFSFSVLSGAGAAYAATPGSGKSSTPWSGSKQLGVAHADTEATGVATDGSGSVYVAGWTTGRLDGNTLTGTTDFFVTRYNSSGMKQWTRQLGAARTHTRATGVATDTGGDAYVAGWTTGRLDGNRLTGTADSFVTRYNSSGTKQWTRQLGVAGAATYGNGVATDTNGNVYVTGYTTGRLDGNTLTGTTDFFVTRYDSSGTKQWTRQLGVADAVTVATGVATDTNGNVYVAGYTDGGLDGNKLSGIGATDFFVTRYNSSGTKQWTRQLGVSDTYAYGVATDTNGNVYVAGYTDGGLDGNPRTGTYDLFVTRYDSSGAKQWTRQLGASDAAAYAYGVATDSNGNVYVAGYTNGDLDGNRLSGIGDRDFFVTRYNSSGMKQWTRQLGVAGKDTYANDVSTDGSGNIFVTGYTTAGLGGNPLAGIHDFFVTKYKSNGAKQ